MGGESEVNYVLIGTVEITIGIDLSDPHNKNLFIQLDGCEELQAVSQRYDLITRFKVIEIGERAEEKDKVGSQLVLKTMENFAQDFSIYRSLFTLTLKELESIYSNHKRHMNEVKITLGEESIIFHFKNGGETVLNAINVKDYNWEQIMVETKKSELVVEIPMTSMVGLIKSCRGIKDLSIQFKRDEFKQTNNTITVWVLINLNNIVMYYKIPLLLYPNNPLKDKTAPKSQPQDLSFHEHTNIGVNFHSNLSQNVNSSGQMKHDVRFSNNIILEDDDESAKNIICPPKQFGLGFNSIKKGSSQLHYSSHNTDPSDYWQQVRRAGDRSPSKKRLKSNTETHDQVSNPEQSSFEVKNQIKDPVSLLNFVLNWESSRLGGYNLV